MVGIVLVVCYKHKVEVSIDNKLNSKILFLDALKFYSNLIYFKDANFLETMSTVRYMSFKKRLLKCTYKLQSLVFWWAVLSPNCRLKVLKRHNVVFNFLKIKTNSHDNSYFKISVICQREFHFLQSWKHWFKLRYLW